MPSIRRNALYSTIYELVRLAFPLITYPYVSRVIGPAGIGQVTYAQTLSTTFSTIALLGLGMYGIREVARSRDDQYALKELFSRLLVLSTGLAWLSLVPYLLLLRVAPNVAAQRFLHFAFGINLVFNSARLDWFFQGMENYRYITVRNFFVRVATVVSLFVLVRDAEDYLVYGMLWVAGTVISSAFNLIFAIRLVGFSWPRFHPIQFLRQVLPSSGLEIVNAYYASIDTILLGALLSDQRLSVGLYSIAGRITRIVLSLVVAGAAVVAPRVAFVAAQGDSENAIRLIRKNIAFVLYASLPMAFGLFLTARDVLVIFAGSQFAGAENTAKVFSIFLVVSAVQSVVGHQVFYSRGKERPLLVGAILAAGLLTLSCTITIPRWGHVGAAASVVGVSVINLLYLCMIEPKVMKQIFLTRTNGKILFIFVIWATLLVSLQFLPLNGPGYLRLIVLVVSGVLAYPIITLIAKVEPAMSLASWILGRKKKG